MTNSSDKDITLEELRAVNQAFQNRINAAVKAGAPERTETAQSFRRRAGITPLQSFLFTVAKVDEKAISLCPHSAKNQALTLAVFVLLTATIAFVSGLYTFRTMLFSQSDPVAMPLAIVLASIYAFGIIMIDRELIASTEEEKWKQWGQFAIRIGMAGMIGLTVSYPVKLLFFEGRIHQEIARMHGGEAERIRERMKKKESEIQRAKETQLEAVRVQIATLTDAYNQFRKLYDDECARVTCGHKAETVIYPKVVKAWEEMSAKEKELKELIVKKGAEHYFDDPEYKDLQKNLIKEEAKPLPYDLLTKWEALDNLSEKIPGYTTITWFVLGFFMIWELIPVLMKVLMGKSEYNYYLQARHSLNTQKIVSITNFYMRALEQRSADLLPEIPSEVTDIIHSMMEDEATGLHIASEPSAAPSPPPEPAGNSSPQQDAPSRSPGFGPFAGEDTIDENQPRT